MELSLLFLTLVICVFSIVQSRPDSKDNKNAELLNEEFFDEVKQLLDNKYKDSNQIHVTYNFELI